jgi:hypothetical protein
VGEVAQRAAELHVARPGEPEASVALSAPAWRLASRVHQGALRLQLDLELARLDGGGLAVGPGVAELVLRDVDAAALLGASGSSAPLGDGATGLGRLGALADPGPLLELVELDLDTADGPLRGAGQARLRPAAADGVEDAVPLVDGRFSLDGPAALFARLPEAGLPALAELPERVAPGERTAVELELDGGVLLAGGEPLAWPARSFAEAPAAEGPDASPDVPDGAAAEPALADEEAGRPAPGVDALAADREAAAPPSGGEAPRARGLPEGVDPPEGVELLPANAVEP